MAVSENKYNVEIVCPRPYGCATDFINNDIIKVTFCEVVEVGPATQSYNRSGQLYGIRKNEEIDTWFIGETYAKTQYNLTRWVNKNLYDQEEVLTSLYEIKKNSGVWERDEECRLWKP
ncbi:4362_t:CDS:2 [Diversispora eburnea]|uniref:4362_t:CDS:1 n=1 Tax=Diversispora eburnea TaxID=1213867 RepID=A0A9N8ZSH1_9GLOM|nr:4362_t:CDS:2 [Diversispora eburnea]